MTLPLTRRTVIGSAAALVFASTVRAETAHTVEMLNKHPDDKKLRNVFYPRIAVVEAGDTVRFAATDKGHNSEAVKDMLPDGVDTWKGRINQEIEVVFTTPGFYGYRCTPHANLGMFGLVIVKGEGMMANYEAAKGVRQRGKGKKVWEEIWAEVEGMELTA